MITPIQIILIIFVLFALSRAWLRYREGSIKASEFGFWLLIWGAAIITIAYPASAGYVSGILGIGRPADLILYVAVALLFYLVFRVYVAVDGIEEKITTIVKEVAISRGKKK